MRLHFVKTLLLASLVVTLVPGASSQEEKPLKPLQVSIFPGFGTEGTDAVNNRYRVSLNIFAGITGGIEGFEAGGFMNIDNGNVKGVQISGFGNVVNGDMEGFQTAGFMNVNRGNTQGFHGAGFINFMSGSAEGFLGAGFINITGGDRRGFSGAGFANITGGSKEGFQGAGFVNVTGKSFEGFQGAGFMNVTGTGFQGIQIAGFGNVAGGDGRGPSIAGFMNINQNIEGMQLAGFLNVAQKVKGIQLGFLNIADTVDGVPIGFLSIVRNGGYRQLELAGSDVMHLGASFRIGVPLFYNIFSYGTRLFGEDVISGFGYGIGTEFRFSEATTLQLEAHHTQLQKNYKWNNYGTDRLSELRVTVDTRLTGRLQLFAGPVLYNHIYRYIRPYDTTPADISSYSIYERHWNGNMSTWWIGGRGGLRLRLD